MEKPVLSERELQVLLLAAEGYQTGQIGNQIGLSQHTVRTHLQNVRQKLSALNTTNAVWEAMRCGLIEPPKKYDD